MPPPEATAVIPTFAPFASTTTPPVGFTENVVRTGTPFTMAAEPPTATGDTGTTGPTGGNDSGARTVGAGALVDPPPDPLPVDAPPDPDGAVPLSRTILPTTFVVSHVVKPPPTTILPSDWTRTGYT